jgi:Na+:H+ antiporter, NhaA family
MRSFIDRSGLLIVGSVLALLWANLDLDSYRDVRQALRFAVNDIGMAFFFALATKEVVEATAPGGPLHSPRRSAMPVVAAVGGMAGPVLVYIGLVTVLGRSDLMRGWAIPTATDIAFSYLIARLIFGDKHSGIPFLLLLAIADDGLGLLILALFYPSAPIRLGVFVGVVGVAMVVAWWLKKRRTKSFWAYIGGAGLLSWLGFDYGGLHPALALVPIIPFLPHAKRDPGFFVQSRRGHDTLSAFEHRWKLPVQIILFFFGLVNAGVAVSSVGTGTWIVLAALIVGKPFGIVGATAVGVLTGLRRPAGVQWRDLMVLGMVGGVGFTVALFFATASFAEGPPLDQTKMGALLSFVAAPLAVALARALGVGRWTRFAPKARHR